MSSICYIKKAVILIPVNLDALLPCGLQNKTKKPTLKTFVGCKLSKKNTKF